jgi:hypothetical protein
MVKKIVTRRTEKECRKRLDNNVSLFDSNPSYRKKMEWGISDTQGKKRQTMYFIDSKTDNQVWKSHILPK